ncbi:MAG: hypothetical protein PVJ40_00045 [Gammaproteobacteria bacterium]|jgi:hypothetical protein
MFIGHYAVALGAKRVMPRVSLGILVAASSLVDLLWPVFLLLGWEQVRVEPGNTVLTPLAFVHYPITHSLVGATGWAVFFGGVYWAATRHRSGALMVAGVTLSHWFLDAIVHRPDLPLWPGSVALIGLGLWNSIPGTVALEGSMFLAGVWLYAAASRPRDGIGRYAFWSLTGLLALIYAANVFGSPPPDPEAVAWVGLAGWLIPFWAEWADRHRRILSSNPGGPVTFARGELD